MIKTVLQMPGTDQPQAPICQKFGLGCQICQPTATRTRKHITNELKTRPEHFDAIRKGEKRFEARRNDRDFLLGDGLLLREYDPNTGYTGRQLFTEITYMLTGEEFGIIPGFVVLGIKLIA